MSNVCGPLINFKSTVHIKLKKQPWIKMAKLPFLDDLIFLEWFKPIKSNKNDKSLN